MSDMQLDEEIAPMADVGLGEETMTKLTPDKEGDDDFVIEIVDDRPIEDQVAPRQEDQNVDGDDFDTEESAEELASMGARTGKRISRLRYEYHEERRAKEAAERIKDEAIRFAQQQQAEVEQLRGVVQRGETVLVSEVRQRAKSDMARAKDVYKGAVSDGDPETLVAAQEAMNLAQIQLHQAEGYAPVVNNPNGQAQQAVEQGQQWVQQQQGFQQPAQAPVQANIVPPNQDPKLLNWLSNNEWFRTNSMMHGAAMGIHEDLVKTDGMNPTSDEYYTRLDEKLRDAFPTFFVKGQDAGGMGNGGPAATPAPSVVASTTGRTSGSKRAPRTMQLTKSQVDVAEALGLSPERYAKQLLKEQGNG